MLDLLDFRPTPGAPKIHCSALARLRSMAGGRLELVMAQSRIGPRGLIIYEEVGSCIWHWEKYLEARVNAEMGTLTLLKRLRHG
jgi:hypothetical protein